MSPVNRPPSPHVVVGASMYFGCICTDGGGSCTSNSTVFSTSNCDGMCTYCIGGYGSSSGAARGCLNYYKTYVPSKVATYCGLVAPPPSPPPPPPFTTGGDMYFGCICPAGGGTCTVLSTTFYTSNCNAQCSYCLSGFGSATGAVAGCKKYYSTYVPSKAATVCT